MDGWLAGWLAGCMHACTHARMHACMYAYVYICVYTFTCVYIYIYMYMCFMYICIYASMSVCIHVHMHMCLSIYLCIYVFRPPKMNSLTRDPEKDLNKKHKVGISQNPLFNKANKIGISHPKVYVWVLLWLLNHVFPRLTPASGVRRFRETSRPKRSSASFVVAAFGASKA